LKTSKSKPFIIAYYSKVVKNACFLMFFRYANIYMKIYINVYMLLKSNKN